MRDAQYAYFGEAQIYREEAWLKKQRDHREKIFNSNIFDNYDTAYYRAKRLFL